MKFNQEQRFIALDGWRGVCALLVAVFHFFSVNHFLELPFFRHGYLFVDFFFVLSGFVVRHAYGHRVHDLRTFAGFALRRFGRLWPLHVTILFAFLLLHVATASVLQTGAALFSGHFSFKSFVANILLLHSMGLFSHLSWNGPSWSISTEFFTYLVFGGLLLVAPGRARPLFWMAMALLGAVILVMYSSQYLNATYDLGIFRCFYGFFLGCCIYELVRWKRPPFNNRKLANAVELIAVIAVIAFVSYWGGSRIESYLAPLVFGAMVYVFCDQRGMVSGWMCRPWFRKLGDWSYSIYLVHALLVMLVFRTSFWLEQELSISLIATEAGTGRSLGLLQFGSRWLMDVVTLLYLAAVIGTASLTYRWIEVPSRRWFAEKARTHIETRSGNQPR